VAHALVTGGAGFIGSHVCELLLQHGYGVDVLDDLSSGKRENVAPGAQLHVGDIRSAEAAQLVGAGTYDVIVHLAAQIDVRKSVADPACDAGINILGTLNLLEAIRTNAAARNTRFVFASSGGALYGDFATPPSPESSAKEPESPYGITKLAAECYLAYYARVHGLDTVALRFGNVYGPRQDPHGEAGVVAIFCNRILGGKPLTVFGDGMQTRDYVYVGDVARAALLAARAKLAPPGRLDDRAFNIGTGVASTVLRLVEVLRRAAGADVQVDFAPPRPGEQRQSVLAIDQAARGLGWRPSVNLEEGLARTFSWFSELNRAA
jgi:UDP-glucose 4-epimerase